MQSMHTDMVPGNEEGSSKFESKELFKKAMSGDWLAVVNTYKNNRWARHAKFTRAKNSVLHLAVSEEDDNVVKQLLDAMEDDEAANILSMKNELGNTPLHVAAAVGLPRICWLLANKCKELVVSARNNARETPLYSAARHGKKRTFFVLHDFVGSALSTTIQQNYDITSICRRGDGNTILHAAVDGQYFGLAIEIINLYPSLVSFNNEMGQSPVHLLANMPQVFESGSRLRGIDHFIYARIKVDPLEPKYKPAVIYTSDHRNVPKEEEEINDRPATCMDFFKALRHVPSSKDLESGDEEYENLVRSNKQRFKENCINAYNFLKIMIKVLPLLLDIGIGIDEIKREKKKHKHASHVMKKLIRDASNWEYEEDGKMPNKDHKQDESEIDTSEPPDEEDLSNTYDSSKGITKRLKKDDDKMADKLVRETPILVAAKRGVLEMVKNILDTFPEAVQDIDSNHKNIILLSIEHRQPLVYKHMLEMKAMRESVLMMVDKDGNSALHLTADVERNNHPWLTSNIALQMQWEIKWYKFVKNSMVPSFFQQYNNKGETAMWIFLTSHISLLLEGGKWLTNTLKSCSVVAAIIATVAYASATTVPGGLDQSGFPILEGKPAFDLVTRFPVYVAFH